LITENYFFATLEFFHRMRNGHFFHIKKIFSKKNNFRMKIMGRQAENTVLSGVREMKDTRCCSSRRVWKAGARAEGTFEKTDLC
jgi:hypothetical protein